MIEFKTIYEIINKLIKENDDTNSYGDGYDQALFELEDEIKYIEERQSLDI